MERSWIEVGVSIPMRDSAWRLEARSWKLWKDGK